eukprot:COSAG01_NODE_34159_length_552_cov_0.902870_1_plen_48_part_10
MLEVTADSRRRRKRGQCEQREPAEARLSRAHSLVIEEVAHLKLRAHTP